MKNNAVGANYDKKWHVPPEMTFGSMLIMEGGGGVTGLRVNIILLSPGLLY